MDNSLPLRIVGIVLLRPLGFNHIICKFNVSSTNL